MRLIDSSYLIAGMRSDMHIKVAPKESIAKFRQKTFSFSCRSYRLGEASCL